MWRFRGRARWRSSSPALASSRRRAAASGRCVWSTHSASLTFMAETRTAADGIDRRPPKPAWVQFLATALGLCDAHDSARQVGAGYATVPDEARRGLSEGRFVSIAWALLEHLRDRELEGAQDYIALGE